MAITPLLSPTSKFLSGNVVYVNHISGLAEGIKYVLSGYQLRDETYTIRAKNLSNEEVLFNLGFGRS